MKSTDIIIIFGLGSAAIIGSIFAAKTNPTLGCAVFDTLSILFIVGLIGFALKRIKIELSYIATTLIVCGISIYLHLVYKVNFFAYKHIRGVALFTLLVLVLGGIRILLSPKRHR